MAIKYATYPLLLATNALDSWFQTYHNRSYLNKVGTMNFNGSSVDHTFIPPPQQQQNIVRLNELSWPTHEASRWAEFYGLCDNETLDLIKEEIGPSNYAKSLVITDGNGGEITVEMYMLPPTPISVELGGTDKELYLLYLVDKRYFYWNKLADIDVAPTTTSTTTTTSTSTSSSTTTSTTTTCVTTTSTTTSSTTSTTSTTPPPSPYYTPNITWRQYLTKIYTALGETPPNLVSIPTEYQYPSYKMISDQRPLPILLDVTYKLLGIRPQFNLDGSITEKNWEDAYTDCSTDYTFNKGRKIAGGKFDVEDLGTNVPATFKANFKSTNDKFTGFTKTLTSLAIPEYNGLNGRTGYIYPYYSDYIYVGTSQYDNICQELTDQAAFDYYGWCITAKTDVTFAGIITWTALAATDTIFYNHSNIITTRVIREPFFICPDTSADTSAETQIIRIPSNTTQNTFGDYLGYIQEYDYINNSYVNSRPCWVRNIN